jgi:hypothetical protein
MTTIAPAKHAWVMSRKQDLVWLHGSVLAGLILLAAFLALPRLDQHNYGTLHPAVWLLLFWGVVFDGSHVMATYARTYFANDAQSKSALPGQSSFAWLLLGPAIALFDHWFFPQQASVVGHAGLLFGGFLAFAYLWAYYHLIRQHYGFLCLYRRKEGHSSSLTSPDTLFLWLGSAYPFLRYNLTDAFKSSGLPVLLPDAWLSPLRLLLDVSTLLGLAAVLAISIYRRQGKIQLGPKHLFLLIVVGFSNLTFALLDNLLVISAVLTIFHNFQYHRIVWQYERGHQRIPLGSIGRYIAAGIGFGLIWYTPRIMGVAMTQSDLLRNILVGLGWGVAFHHYYIDARIWRVRRQPTVAAALEHATA